MSKYTGKTVTIDRPRHEINDKFADLTVLETGFANMPEADRAKVGDIKFEKDAIIMNTQQIGEIRFNVVENSPERIALEAVGSPIPLTLEVKLAAVGESTTEAVTSMDVEIPAMLRPFIGPQMQKAVDRFGDMIAKIAR